MSFPVVGGTPSLSRSDEEKWVVSQQIVALGENVVYALLRRTQLSAGRDSHGIREIVPDRLKCFFSSVEKITVLR